MLTPLHNPIYRRLFAAQILSLAGTGLITVALGLLAYDLAGDRAGLVLGTVLFIKMVAYVGLAPLAQAAAARISRRRFLVSLDLLRAGLVLCLPFVSQIWQIYLLVFLMQAASAAFTPAFQATIPELLPDENTYTKALTLSRLAYEMEALLSPLLAAVLLLVMPFSALFAGTALGFVASAVLILSVTLPQSAPQGGRFIDRATRGVRIFLATPRLRGLLALNLVAAAASSMVIVNSVVIVQSDLGLGETDLALSLAAYGVGSILAAMALPGLLERVPDRQVMTLGAVIMAAGLGAYAVTPPGWAGLLAIWIVLGLGFSMVVTPSGRLLRRSAHHVDLPAVFAAQFALSHLCWLITYPLAGWLGSVWGAGVAAMGLAGMSVPAILLAWLLWPGETSGDLPHDHPDLSPDHPHLQGPVPHRHRVIIDDLHRHWPLRG
ncbi:MFS transporter [Halovulum sp. GXIMD14793]